MDEQQVADELIKQLKGYVYSQIGGFAQEPYKGAYFRIFAKAYNAGLQLTADRLIDLISASWPIEPYDEDKRADGMKRLYLAWTEWKYAWDHVHLKAD